MQRVYAFIIFCRNHRKIVSMKLRPVSDWMKRQIFPLITRSRSWRLAGCLSVQPPSTWANCHTDSKRFNNSIDAGDDFVIVVGLGVGAGVGVGLGLGINTIDGGSI